MEDLESISFAPSIKETVDLEKLLVWSEPKSVPTENGERLICKAKPTEEFWQLWNSRRAALKAAGITVSVWPKSSDNWQVVWWKPVPKEELERREASIRASLATDAALDIPAPEGFAYLGYQRAGVRFMSERFQKPDEGVLLADEMGLGKTIQILALMNLDTKINRVLIICPAGLKFNWLKEIRKWLVRAPALSVGVADADCFPTTDIVIINFDILHKYEKSLSFFWDLIVIDEGHYLVNRKVRRTQCVFGYRPSRNDVKKEIERRGLEGTKEDADKVFASLRKSPLNARRKAVLTGTPLVNKTADLFELIHWLDPKRWDDAFKFKLRYCAGRKTGFGWEFKGASHTDELQRELRAGVMLRRLKKDVLKDLPPKFRRVVELQNSTDTQPAVRAESEKFSPLEARLQTLQLRAELCKAGEDKRAYVEAVRMLNEGVKVAFEEMARVRHQTAVAKIPLVVERIKAILEEDPEHKMVFFAHHLDLINALRKEWPTSCVVVGGMAPEAKQAEVDRYQKTGEPLFFGGMRAAAEGITLTASSHVIFLEEDWTAVKISQAEDRCHRIGQHDNVLVEHWVLEKSLDVNIAQTNVLKQEVMDSVLDEQERAEVANVVTVPTNRAMMGMKEQERETATFAAVTEAAKRITDGQRENIHRALRKLSEAGFSAADAALGMELAKLPFITPRQAVFGRKICLRHQKLIGDLAAKI